MSWSTSIVLVVVVSCCANVLHIHFIPVKGLTHCCRSVELFRHDRMENCRPLCHLFLVRRKALGRLQSKASLWRHAGLCQSAGLKCSTAHAGILQKCPNMFRSDHQTQAINMARNLDALMSFAASPSSICSGKLPEAALEWFSTSGLNGSTVISGFPSSCACN